MVSRLFYIDGYTSEFYASVVSSEKCENGYAVILDRTAFFPESGGQYGDTGFIGNAAVTDTQEKDGEIIHFTDSPVTGVVFCRIDWQKRFNRMQNHTGEHIFSGIVCKKYGCANVGFHLGDGIVTMDYDYPIPESDVKFLQAEANNAIFANLPVRTYFPANFSELNYRSKLDLTENVRIVEIPGIDICACCAPHVRSTGEIGVIKIIGREKYKSGVRFYMKCGSWALEDFEQLDANSRTISAFTSRPREKTAEAVAELQSKLADSLNRERQLKQKLLYLSVGDKPCIFVDDASMLKDAVNLLKEKRGNNVCALCGNDESGYRFMLLYSSEAFKEDFCRELSANGGGRNGMLQGKTDSKKDRIIIFFEKFK